MLLWTDCRQYSQNTKCQWVSCPSFSICDNLTFWYLFAIPITQDFIVDDSGSMNNITDSYLPNGNPMTRWVEAITRLKTMIEIISFLPVNWIRISFLNRRDVIQENRAGKLPQQFCSHIWGLLVRAVTISNNLGCFGREFAEWDDSGVSRAFRFYKSR